MTTIQREINFAEAEAQKGIERSVSKADRTIRDWSVKCENLFIKFLKEIDGKKFMIEDFRNWCIGKIEKPPSNRAFGFIPRKFKKIGMIEHAGYGKTSNEKAHGTPASIWVQKK